LLVASRYGCPADRSKALRPPTTVTVTRAFPLSTAGISKMFRSSITKSASRPSREHAPVLIVEAGEGGSGRVGADGFLHGDLLVGDRALGVPVGERPPCDGGVDAFQGCGRRHEPVAPEREHGPGNQQRAEHVGGPDAVTAVRLCPAAVVDGVIRLHAGNDAELPEPWDVGRREVLRVLDAEPPIACTMT
jgi:hypothetical protein